MGELNDVWSDLDAATQSIVRAHTLLSDVLDSPTRSDRNRLVRDAWVRLFESVAEFSYTDDSGDVLRLTPVQAADLVVTHGVTFSPIVPVRERDVMEQ